MLYDPKWNYYQAGTFEHFAGWLAEQPADKRYNWDSRRDCACGQYAREIGERAWFRKSIKGSGFWHAANLLALGDAHHNWTFVELLVRVRTHLAEIAR